MMQSGRTALASSGRISGSGLASARMIGLVGHGLDHLGVSTPAAEQPRNTSAPFHHIGQRARLGVLRIARLGIVEAAGAAG
jgi:hypothetical protein